MLCVLYIYIYIILYCRRKCFNNYFFVAKVTTLPDVGIFRWLQADRQQFGHQDEGVYVRQRLELVQICGQD